MGAKADFDDLIDEVSEAPGWTVKRNTVGWAIYPANALQSVINTRVGYDTRFIANLRARLRRAGFQFAEQHKPRIEMPETKVQLPAAPPAPAAAVEDPKPDLIARARHHINNAITELSLLEGVLGEIGVERDAFAQLKSMLQKLSR